MGTTVLKNICISEDEQITFFVNRTTTSLGTNASSECKGYNSFKKNIEQGDFYL